MYVTFLYCMMHAVLEMFIYNFLFADTNRNNKQVAGGTGHLSLSLAQAYPKLRFIVQDLPEQGKAFSVPSHLQDRVQFMSHDMFQPQPIAADAYILRLICHDWPDVASSQILRQLVPAMRDGARIILVEAVMLEPGHVSGPAERVYRYDYLQTSNQENERRLTC